MNIQGEVAPHDHQALAFFVRDLKGNSIVLCGNCGNETVIGPEKTGKYTACLHCGWELLYPAGANW